MNPRPHFARPHPGGRRGFTLVEILVVMVIGAVLFGAMVGTFSGNVSLRCQAASKSTAALFNQASQWAVSTGSTVRLLIHQDPAEPERIGRYLALVRSAPVSPPEGDSPDTGTESEESGDAWILGDTLQFAEGIYYSPEDVGSEEPPQPLQITLSKEGGTFGEGTLWTAFEFSPRGICEQEGSHVIFRPGFFEDGSHQPSSDTEFSGFTVQRSGKAVFFEPFDPLPNP